MGWSSLSGPLRVGTVKEGAMDNTGCAVLSQTFPITTAASQPIAVLPAGSQIVDVIADIVTAFTAGATMSIGTAANATAFGTVAPTTAGRSTLTITGAQAAAIQNIGPVDQVIYATVGGAPAAGAGFITVQYVQKSPAGLSHPTPSEV